MTDITAFLTARLDEDEAAADAYLNEVALAIYNAATAHPRRKPCENFMMLPSLVQARYRALALEGYPASARVLAEVKAKRALIGYWRICAENFASDENDEAAGSAWAAMNNVLVTLAGVHRTHPDYAGDDVDDWTWPDDEAREVDVT